MMSGQSQATETTPLLNDKKVEGVLVVVNTPQTLPTRNDDVVETKIAGQEQVTQGTDEMSEEKTHTVQELKRNAQINLLVDLYIKCTRHHRMHRLSHEYFIKRDAAFNFFPLLLLTMISSILSFLATVDMVHVTLREIFSISVSICSIISVGIQSYAKYSNYATKTESHRTAALGMLKLGNRLEVQLSDPELHVPPEFSGYAENENSISSSKVREVMMPEMREGSNKSLQSAGYKSTATTSIPKSAFGNLQHLPLEDKIQISQMVYNQIVDACDSSFPKPLSQAFAILDSRLNISFRNKYTNVEFAKNLDIDPDLCSRLGEKMIMICAYNELFTELSNAPGWPWFSTKPQRAVEKAIARVHRTYTLSTKSFLAVDIHMDEDIKTLCAWAFCCCMDPTSWFWASCVRKRRELLKKRSGMV